ncbi:uncharacterized protein K452DRAFT_120834 [Aplosporella prunicola CBS 121167]|uniref:Uncharacterized protein n=1 Tax=Aplosporella prunicola CBS 121167 TaxID=1176127 RepID=A0A6A6BN37_9PEZI|nr:uncharacterized protein K452DRAFT_120834 [Aplosporella prunicola CBS 121167]KAF2145496.1 hypothetical protein K452DRAFT_120834 [Aplosporella prunicola CBS 121167]
MGGFFFFSVSPFERSARVFSCTVHKKRSLPPTSTTAALRMGSMVWFGLCYGLFFLLLFLDYYFYTVFSMKLLYTHSTAADAANATSATVSVDCLCTACDVW